MPQISNCPTIAELTVEQRQFIADQNLFYKREDHRKFIEKFGFVDFETYKKLRVALKR